MHANGIKIIAVATTTNLPASNGWYDLYATICAYLYPRLHPRLFHFCPLMPTDEVNVDRSMIHLGPPEEYEGMKRDPVPRGGYPPLRRRPNPQSNFNKEHWPESGIPTTVCVSICLVAVMLRCVITFG